MKIIKSISLIMSVVFLVNSVFALKSIASDDVIVVESDSTSSSNRTNNINPGSSEDTTVYGSDVQNTTQDNNTNDNSNQDNTENQEVNIDGINSIDDIVNKSSIDEESVKQIIEFNNKNKKKETLEKSEVELEYTTKYQNNANLPQNVVQVIQEGKAGTQEVITKKVYENENMVDEKEISAVVLKTASNKIVQIGTSDVVSNYKIKVGDTLYVTSDLIGIMLQPDENSQRIISISRGQGVVIKQIQGSWVEVSYNSYTGWTKSECLTFFNEKNDYSSYLKDPMKVTVTAQQASGTLDFNMDLRAPTGLSLDQYTRVLSNNSQDKKGVISNNARYFYIAEQQYNINGLFLASMAVHESNWGTSDMANNKKNLFGYGAYDRDPSGNAYVFSDYNESIDLVARVLVKSYLNTKGTAIYNGEVATGSFYNGPTLTGVNTRYASDKNWANSVYKWMTYFYGRI